MSLHKGRLFGGKAGLLTKQRRELLVNLSDVVEQRRCFHLLDFLCREAQFDSNRPRHFTDTKGVPGGVWIPTLDCFHHNLQELLPTVLSLVVQAVDMTHPYNGNDDPDQAE